MIFMTIGSLSQLWGKAWPVLLAILFFGVLIMSHETGHFLFARLFKVKVNEFAFGMGPAIISRQKGQTKYSWRLFPIGGFCAMEGEDEDSESEGAFCSKPAWQRFIIVAAGATVNLIMGFILVCIMLGFTTAEDEGIGTRYILRFDEKAVSCDSGLAVKDEIIKINGKHVFSMNDVSFLMLRDDDGIMDITVKRNGKKVELKDVKFDTVKNEDGKGITTVFDFTLLGVEPTFKNVMANSVGNTVTLGRMVYLTLFDLITGKYGLNDLSGPIGTVGIVADVAGGATAESSPWTVEYLFLIMSLICVNIGLFNLMPIPALDGGRLFFILIEMIFRKPIPRKYENKIHAIGMVLLLLFMAVVSFNDILKLIRGELY